MIQKESFGEKLINEILSFSCCTVQHPVTNFTNFVVWRFLNAFSLHRIYVVVDQSLFSVTVSQWPYQYKYWRNMQIKRRAWIFSLFSCLFLVINIFMKFNSFKFVFLQLEFLTKQYFITKTVRDNNNNKQTTENLF